MNYLQKKKLALMSIVNSVKGFVRTITGALPLTLEGCVDEESIIDYTLYGQSVQNGTPTPETPVEVESVGEKTKNLFNYADYTTLTNYNGNDISANWLTIDGDLFYIKYDYYNGGCWLTPTKQWGLLAGTYTLSGKCKDNTIKGNPNICYCGIRWSDDTRNAGWGKTNSNDGEWYNFSYTFTITEDKTVKGIYLQDNGTTAKSSICFTNIQLEEGSTATPYEPYGYKIPITVSGKNLFDKSEYIDDNGRIGFSVKHLVIGTRYTISSNKPLTRIKISHRYASYNSVTYLNADGWYKYSFTMNRDSNIPANDTQYLYIGNTIGKSDFIADISQLDGFDIQLEEGTTATDYEPYHEPITTNIYLDEPLRKVGDYADYIDFENGKVVRNVGKYTFTGNETDMGGADKDTACVGYVVHISGLSLTNYKRGLCKHAPVYTETSIRGISRLAFHPVANHPYCYVFFKKTDFPDLTAKQITKQMYDSGNPLVLYYNRNTPRETPITLPKIPTFKGTSILNADTTIQPSNAEIEYYSNVKE